MKNKRLRILFGGVALICATFLLFNFRVAASYTQNIQKIMTSELAGNYPDRPQQENKISMVLVGEGPLVSALQEALTELIDKVGLGQIELEQELEPKYPNPALVVIIGRSSQIWTPLFAMSCFSIQVAYATNGDTTFIEVLDKTQPHIHNPDPLVVNLYTEYQVSDRSVGLISRLGYHNYLADYLAKEIVKALKNLYNIQDQTGGILRVSRQQF